MPREISISFPLTVASQSRSAQDYGSEPQIDKASDALMRRAGSEQWPALDHALIRSIASGSEHAMRMLFARHGTRIYRFLLRLGIDHSLAEDLLNEVFIVVWRDACRYRGQSQVSTWLLAIARNKAISQLRRRKYEQCEPKHECVADPNGDPERILDARQRADLLRSCLTSLSLAHREIVDLVYYHGRSIAEVAEIVGIPPGTVKTRMFYARSRLAKLMRKAAAAGVC
jgi:RNA polymerase sigma-70 factor (ECF subfamily)